MSEATRPKTHTIVPANEALIAEIEIWLDEEEARYQEKSEKWEASDYQGERPPRGFRCNWDTVKRYWRDMGSRVHVLLVDGDAVGFLDGTDILEIRPDLRGKGYGRSLADFMIDQAFVEGRSVIEIEIAPPSARPFWERMGFTIVDDRHGNGNGIYAFKLLPRTCPLGTGQRVPFKVEFFSEEARYSGEPIPFLTFSGVGELGGDGQVQLPERAYCFHPIEGQDGDCFVRIELAGDVLIFDKVKREECEALGVKQDIGYIYFIDRIASPSVV